MRQNDNINRNFRLSPIFPPIKEANLEPYRVDHDPSVSIPIDEIEEGIRNAEICIADISIDNPNVWFELGFAIACKKAVILICSEARKEKFPFDVYHRRIIQYQTDSRSDFEKLSRDVYEGIKSEIDKKKKIEPQPILSTAIDSLEPPKTDEVGEQNTSMDMDRGVKKAKILVIEDDMGSREDICKILELEGFNPIAAGNGEMGVEKAKAELPDLVLCDIKMPGMNGYEVLDELRKDPVTEQIPFIFLTVFSNKDNVVKGLELGAQDYLCKPFDRGELIARIRKHLKSG